MSGAKSVWFGIGFVLSVAAGKTALVSALLLDEGLRTLPVISSLFVVFFVLTGIVTVISYRFLGQIIVSKYDARKLAAALQEPGKENIIEMHARDWGLSKAETEVAILVVKGFSNAEIAKMRGSVLSTVKTQLGAIYHKSGLENRYQLIAFITDEVCQAAKARRRDDSAKQHRAHPKAVSTPNPEASVTKFAAHQRATKMQMNAKQ